MTLTAARFRRKEVLREHVDVLGPEAKRREAGARLLRRQAAACG